MQDPTSTKLKNKQTSPWTDQDQKHANRWSTCKSKNKHTGNWDKKHTVKANISLSIQKHY